MNKRQRSGRRRRCCINAALKRERRTWTRATAAAARSGTGRGRRNSRDVVFTPGPRAAVAPTRRRTPPPPALLDASVLLRPRPRLVATFRLPHMPSLGPRSGSR